MLIRLPYESFGNVKWLGCHARRLPRALSSLSRISLAILWRAAMIPSSMRLACMRGLRQGEALADMGKKHHVFALAFACGASFPSEITTLADFKSFAKARDREFGSLASMNETSSTSLLGEKSRGLLQNFAFLTKNLILLAHPRELLGDILMRTLEHIGLLVLGSPPAQRRFRNAKIIYNPRDAAPAGLGQPNGLPFELIRETPLFVPAHRHLLYPS